MPQRRNDFETPLFFDYKNGRPLKPVGLYYNTAKKNDFETPLFSIIKTVGLCNVAQKKRILNATVFDYKTAILY
jgi:hypothetical protein